MSSKNPYEAFLASPGTSSAADSSPAPPQAAMKAKRGRPTGPAAFGALMPQRAVTLPDAVDRLPVWGWDRDEPVWWLGVHGGAGETTLAAASGVGRAASHMWPRTPSGRAQVLLVARTNLHGLNALRRAAQQWAAGDSAGAVVIGAVLVADQPKPLPRPLRDLQRVVSGGVPRTWVVPWVPAWRVEEVTEQNVPSSVKKVLASATADIVIQ